MKTGWNWLLPLNSSLTDFRPETELAKCPAEHPAALVALAAKAIAGADRTQVSGCRRADGGVEDVEIGITPVASATVILRA